MNPALSLPLRSDANLGIKKYLYAGDIQDNRITAVMYKEENAHLAAKEVTCQKKMDGRCLAIEDCLAQNNRRIITSIFRPLRDQPRCQWINNDRMIHVAVQNNSFLN